MIFGTNETKAPGPSKVAVAGRWLGLGSAGRFQAGGGEVEHGPSSLVGLAYLSGHRSDQ